MSPSTTRTRSAARLLLAFAGLLTLVTGVGCVEDEEIDPQLEYRLELLADSIRRQFVNPPNTSGRDCTIVLRQGTDAEGDAQLVRKAVEEAEEWDVICLQAGIYMMGMNGGTPVDGTISVDSTPNLTIKGLGDTFETVVLDFAGQLDDEGFLVTTSGFWIENMWIRNTVGNAVQVGAVNASNNPNVFRKMKVTWDAGSVTSNGAYAIYPANSEWVIVEFSETSGGSVGGIYLDRVAHGIVRNNFTHGNLIGVGVENAFDVTVLGNAVSDNSLGIVVRQEPVEAGARSEAVLVRNNDVRDNNLANFAEGGTREAQLPTGTGIMTIAGTNVEVRTNTIEDNDSTAVFVASNLLFDDVLDAGSPPFVYPEGYDPYPTVTYYNENFVDGNGTAPVTLFLLGLSDNSRPIPDFIWDGFISDGASAGSVVGIDPDTMDPIFEPVPEVFDPEICIGSVDTPSFAITDSAIIHPTPDPKWIPWADGNACDLPELPDTSFP